MVTFYALVTFVMAMQGPLVYVFVEEFLRHGPALAGLLFSTLGIGAILGGLLMSVLESRIRNRFLFALNILFFDGVILFGFAVNHYIPLSLVLFSLLGVRGFPLRC
jgi:cyanate permease